MMLNLHSNSLVESVEFISLLVSFTILYLLASAFSDCQSASCYRLLPTFNCRNFAGLQLSGTLAAGIDSLSGLTFL